MIRLRNLFLALCLAAACALPGPPSALAQTPAPQTAPEVQEARTRLDGLKSSFDQIEAGLSRQQNDGALAETRNRLSELLDQTRKVIDEQSPRVDAQRSRLEQLGPKPDAKAPPETPDAAKERAEREQMLAESLDVLNRGKALAVQGEQLVTIISDRRRSLFARQLLERNTSALSPVLWGNIATALPGEMQAIATVFSDWFRSVAGSGDAGRLGILAVGLALALIVLGPFGLLFRRYLGRPKVSAPPPRSERAIRNGAIAALGVIRPVGAAYIAYYALELSGFLPGRIGPVIFALLGGAAFIAASHAVATAIFSPDRPMWRLVQVPDIVARRLVRIFVAAAGVQVTGKALEATFQSIGSSLTLTVGVRAVFSLLFALLLWRGLAALRSHEEEPDGVADVPRPRDRFMIWRLLLVVALSAILIGALTGYIAFAAFLADQIIWLFMVGTAYFILDYLLTELVESIGRPGNRFTEQLRSIVGFHPRAVRQASVVIAGLSRALLFIVAVMLAIAPWGVESSDLLGSLRAALFGFKIGDVTVSLSSLFIAIGVLGAGVFITRSLQDWLGEKFLPNTDLDSGIKNSLKLAVGYFGTLAAIALAISSIGLSLERITLVAGALSVGIGLGLQSVVNNFVSGLILLWERPIRVGDLIQVGADSGTVRRINVRSTEILTADRSTIIIPNSTLISGTVTNRVHTDRATRIVIPFIAPRSHDPKLIAELLTKAAAANELVMRDPKPRTLFKKMTDAQMEFELICFVGDIDLSPHVTSDLHFAIHEAMASADLPAPGGKTAVQAIEEVEERLSQVAEILSHDRPARPADKG